MPVVINFHGGGSNAAQQRRYSGMDAAADRHGFVVVYPDGTGLRPGQRHLLTFNAGRCCPPATRHQVDDVGFTHAIIKTLAGRIPVDPRRIYATGMSNGGMMAHRLAAESPYIAAVAPVAGQLNVSAFAPRRPVPVRSSNQPGRTSLSTWSQMTRAAPQRSAGLNQTCPATIRTAPATPRPRSRRCTAPTR
jgi:polyhydroxybutyrate depolymerase